MVPVFGKGVGGRPERAERARDRLPRDVAGYEHADRRFLL
jgi:hypothetical protein